MVILRSLLLSAAAGMVLAYLSKIDDEKVNTETINKSGGLNMQTMGLDYDLDFYEAEALYI